MMALNGAGFAGYADAFATFARGVTPDSLTPIDGGTELPFLHDSEREEAASTEAGLVTSCVLVAYVQERLAVGAQYTWSGDTWQVARVDAGRAGGYALPYRTELVRHVR